MSVKRAHIVFSGTVQGVGFRLAAENAAGAFGIDGWVQNLPDGTVEVLCEGEEEDVRRFFNELKTEMSHYIRSSDINWESPTGEFKGFNIKFYR